MLRSALGGAVNTAYTMLSGGSLGDGAASFAIGALTTGVGIKFFGGVKGLLRNAFVGLGTGAGTNALTQGGLIIKDISFQEVPRGFKLAPVFLSGAGHALGRSLGSLFSNRIAGDIFGYLKASPYEVAGAIAYPVEQISNKQIVGSKDGNLNFEIEYELPNISLSDYSEQYFD